MSNILRVKIGDEWVSIPALIGPTGPRGVRGYGIASITKTGTEGLVDTYTITYDNGATTTFNITNGRDTTVRLGESTIGDEFSVTNVGTDYDVILNFTFPEYVSPADLTEKLQTYGNGLLFTDGLLYLTSDGNIISEGIEVQAGGGGGGGGGTGVTFVLTSLMDKNYITIPNGSEISIRYEYTDEQDQPATVSYIVNNVVRQTSRLPKNGTYSYNPSQYFKAGTNSVQIRVTDIYGGARSLFFTINTIDLTISSTFDPDVVYTSPIDFRYTPTGSLEKTIHFEVDGVELPTETVINSGRPQSKIITLSHGVHTLRVWATGIVNDNEEVSSNVLYYEIMYIDGAGTLITSNFRDTDFTQGETLRLDFLVYSTESYTTDVEIFVDNVSKTQMTVDRTRKYWYYKLNDSGQHTIKIVANNTEEKSFVINVKALEIDVSPVEDNLTFLLSGMGRTNADVNREDWSYGDISCILSGFNWVNNGWINNGLKISNGASVVIPLQIFSSDFRVNGKTIELDFEITDVANYDSILLSCMSGNRGIEIGTQTATLKSEQSTLDIKFKEEERVKVAFVIEPRSSHRLIYTYLNGILSGLTQYPADDTFIQLNPVNITLGSDTCGITLYSMRVYDAPLSSHDVLKNFIADIPDFADQVAAFNRNDIYDDYGNIVFGKILNQLPIMTFTGDLPSTKGDKKTITVTYENATDSARNFEMENVTLDIQGTSSQYYPKKNYKISKLPQEYSLRAGAPGEKKFTLKADYMESSHAHNTGLAKLFHDMYSDLTPPQVGNDRIRTTIDGFPIAIYYRPTPKDDFEYFGVYNFNNDKESSNTFGFTEGCESWEFGNNTSDRTKFLSDDFSDAKAVLTDFEARYPKDYTDFTKLHQLVSWVVSCDSNKYTGSQLPEPVTYEDVTYTHDSREYRVAKFKDECPSHFNMNYLLTYYILSEFFGMVDSRAKNMFLNNYGGDVWYPVFYDLDTALGLNNEGVNDFNFDIEYHDVIGTQNVFNGENSALWNMVERAFPTEIEELYNSLRNSNKLSYEKVMSVLYDEQIAKICEAQYNEDAEFKYLSPLIEDGIATYLYTAQGSRADHMKWWLMNRFKYMDSKYTASAYKSNYLTMRLYTPTDWQDVKPNGQITLTSFIDQYLRIKYGSYVISGKATHNVPLTLSPPSGNVFNDTETIVYGADKITSIGDMSPLYAGTIDVSSAVKLTELKIGAGGNYRNTNLRSLTLGNNILLNSLDIRNCPQLSGALDLSGCIGLTTLKATGTSLASVKLADGGRIRHLYLPDTITNLTIKNQMNIEYFECGYNEINTLVLENTNLDSLNILQSSPNVAKLRLTGINWTLQSFDILDFIYENLSGVDEQGLDTEKAILQGTITMDGVLESVMNTYKSKFMGITFRIINPLDEDAIRTDDGKIITTNTGVAFLRSVV